MAILSFFKLTIPYCHLICLISLYMFSPLFTWVGLLLIAAIYLPFVKWHGTDLHDCILAHTFKWVKNGDRGTEHCLRWMANNACVHPYITHIKYQWLLNPTVIFCCAPHRLELFLPFFFPVTPVGAFVFHVLCGRAYRRERARTRARRTRVHGHTLRLLLFHVHKGATAGTSCWELSSCFFCFSAWSHTRSHAHTHTHTNPRLMYKVTLDLTSHGLLFAQESLWLGGTEAEYVYAFIKEEKRKAK